MLITNQHSLTVPELYNGLRLDQAITKMLPDITRTHVQKEINAGNVLLNGVIMNNISKRVKEGDAISIILITEEENQELVPYEYKLDILFEDDDLMVINKPVNMVTHPGAGKEKNSLANALIHHTKNLSDINGPMRPGIVHRLDKDTSGLMLVAKNNETHEALAQQIQSRECVRQYLACVWGMIRPTSGTININIGRKSHNRKVMTCFRKGGKEAITHYETKEIFLGGLISLVQCKLDTGRTHQIRVHLSQLGHSVIGDQTYGNNAKKISNIKKIAPDVADVILGLKRQALHSCYIQFTHPRQNEQMLFENNPPLDYTQLLKSLRNE